MEKLLRIAVLLSCNTVKFKLLYNDNLKPNGIQTQLTNFICQLGLVLYKTFALSLNGNNYGTKY